MGQPHGPQGHRVDEHGDDQGPLLADLRDQPPCRDVTDDLADTDESGDRGSEGSGCTVVDRGERNERDHRTVSQGRHQCRQVGGDDD